MTDTDEAATLPDNLITRAEAAALIGVTERTITRYQAQEYLTVYRDDRGRVRFDPEQVSAMNRFAVRRER